MDFFSEPHCREKMLNIFEGLKKSFSSLRAGRASAQLLDKIMVEAYGNLTPLSQLATISVPESRMLSVQVWDKGLSKTVEKAISESELGLNPMSDAQLIRVPLPELTQERRKEIVKVAAKYSEQAKISIRNIRREFMDDLKKYEKQGDISEDEQRDLHKIIQDITDEFVKNIDEQYNKKEKDILTI